MARETLTVLARRSALAGRTAIVTGASGAFGSATMEVLRYLGAHPIGIDRKPGDGVLACDVTNGEQVAAVICEATGQLGGRLDLLIHHAGVGPAVDVGQPPGKETREALDVNLLGPWRVTAAARPALLEARGRVIITASLLAVITRPFAAAYTVAKGALTAWAYCAWSTARTCPSPACTRVTSTRRSMSGPARPGWRWTDWCPPSTSGTRC